MAIVTPYPVGSVTDPFVDCDTWCTSDVSSNPYPTATFIYNPPWVDFSPVWSITTSYSEGKEFIKYDGSVYFSRFRRQLYRLNMATGAYTQVSSAYDGGAEAFLAINAGVLKGLYCCISKNSWNAIRLIKWNDVDSWILLSKSINNELYCMVYVSPYIYIGSDEGMERWDGSTLAAIVRENTLSAAYSPMYVWYDGGTIYAFCVHRSTKIGCIASWDMSGTPTVPGVFVQLSDFIANCYDYSNAVWYNDTIYFSRNNRELLRFNKSTHAIETVIGATSDYIKSFLVHSDGWLYAYVGTQQLLKWRPGEAGWIEVIGAYTDARHDHSHKNVLLEYDSSIYAMTGGDMWFARANRVSKMEITTSGCTISDPYDYESLCTDPDYIT